MMRGPSAKLIREWDAKLRASGFEDIEYRDHAGAPVDMLKHACRIDEERHPHQLEPTTEYFSRAAEYLHRGGLTGIDRRVWALHVEGSTLREIAKALGISLRRSWCLVQKGDAGLAVWWESTRAEREQERRAPRGRPRLDDRGAVRAASVQAMVTPEEFSVSRRPRSSPATGA